MFYMINVVLDCKIIHITLKGLFLLMSGKGKGHPCTGTEALYTPYIP